METANAITDRVRASNACRSKFVRWFSGAVRAALLFVGRAPWLGYQVAVPMNGAMSKPPGIWASMT